MPKTRKQKEEIVADLKDRLSKSKSLVFTDYKGMTMSQMSALRNQLSDLSAEFTVTKNNLLKIALADSRLMMNDKQSLPAGAGKQSLRSDDLERIFEGPIATLFSYGDEIAGIKVLAKAIKDSGIGRTKAGFLNGEFLTDDQVNKLALLPTKDELRAKVVGALGSPLYGIVGVLQANLRNLVYALDAVRKQKGGE